MKVFDGAKMRAIRKEAELTPFYSDFHCWAQNLQRGERTR